MTDDERLRRTLPAGRDDARTTRRQTENLGAAAAALHDTAVPELPPLIGGRYAPVRLIGQGGMGTVYEVEHARTGERLALKLLRSGAGASGVMLERFKREARASARIKSDHVVRVLDADVAPNLNGAPFIVMELLAGFDLETGATQARPTPAVVVDWLRQVAVAIDKAHGLGIVHRDLKPENLFLAEREDGPPIIKILDFGIVKMIEDGTWVTASDEILGTPRYMSPEQATAGAPVTPATDRYALGLVAYRLLAGESYYGDDLMTVIGQLLNEPLRPPSTLHPELGAPFDAWFARACHRDPDQRFASAGEQVEALAAALGVATTAPPASAPGQSTAPGPAVAAAGRPRRPPVVAVALTLALAILIGALLAKVTVVQRQRQRPAAPSQVMVAPP